MCKKSGAKQTKNIAENMYESGYPYTQNVAENHWLTMNRQSFNIVTENMVRNLAGNLADNVSDNLAEKM